MAPPLGMEFFPISVSGVCRLEIHAKMRTAHPTWIKYEGCYPWSSLTV